MIRPEARAALRRWREVLAGGMLAAPGLWLWASSYGIPALLGLAMMAGGGFLALTGIRLARMRDGGGPGVVEVVEGRIGYLGPEGGGWVALDLLERVEKRDRAWHLTTPDDTIVIPIGARGAEALPDALGPLPGFDGGRMARAARGHGDATVWMRRAGVALPGPG